LRSTLLVYVTALLVLTSTAFTRTWYVTPSGSGDAATIGAAVDSASNGDVIMLADGIYRGAGNHDVVITKSVTIRSESGDPEACIIDCEGSAAVNANGLDFVGVTGTLLDGITIMNAYGYYAEALEVEWDYGDVLIVNCRFVDNYTDYIAPSVVVYPGWSGVIRFSECLFSGNVAGEGGAALFFNWHRSSYATVEVDRCTFTGNSGYRGCIVFNWWMSDALQDDVFFQFTNCTIAGNSGRVLMWNDTYKTQAGSDLGGSSSLQYYWWSMSQSIIAYNDLLYTFLTWEEPFMTCVDIYGNTCGDWVGAGSDQYGVRGNFSACPSFCGAGQGDFILCDGSPCLPGNHPEGYECGLVGAWEEGCSCGPSKTTPSTWGGIKALYR
jgi:hypothetical protein